MPEVTDDKPAESVLDSLRALLASSTDEPPEDTIERLGGWQLVIDEIANTVDDPVSVVMVRIVARDATAGGDDAIAAMPTLVDAVLAMESPTGFAESLEVLLCSAPVLDAVSGRLSEGLLVIAASIADSENPSTREVSRAADALEAATRIVVGGYGSRFALLAALERFRAPMPKRFAAAVVRSVGTAVDHWPEAASLMTVVEVVAGLISPTGPTITGADPADVASDASWVLANIELVQALRAHTRAAMLSHLENSVEYLSLGVAAYDRDDAKILKPVVVSVRALTGAEPGMGALAAALPPADDVARLIEQQIQFNLTLSGVDHWYADVKQQMTVAWVALLEDLDRAREQLLQQAFYRPEAAIDNLLQVYQASRSMQVVRREEDLDGVLDVVKPVIEAGFASNAAFVANLTEYTSELAKRLGSAEDAEQAVLTKQHDIAAEVLAEARTVLLRDEPPGKGDRGAATLPLPHQLDRLFGSDTDEAAKLRGLGQAALARLADAVENTSAARHPTLQESRILRSLQSALAASTEYAGQVKIAMDEIILAMVRFVGNRQNAQESRLPYLFDADANEDALHEDLYDYLSYAVGPLLDMEVEQVGGGRADLRIKYAEFSVYLELKSDGTLKPLADKGAYLNQAATYQATDVRIGFVVALRVKAFPRAGAHPHLTSLFTHATVDVAGDRELRHLVLVDVPGNRSSPAAKKAKV